LNGQLSHYLACLATVASIIRGPLFQRASSVELVQHIGQGTMDIQIAPMVPAWYAYEDDNDAVGYYTGIYTNAFDG